VLADDPMLTPRPSKGKKPLRVVLDNTLRIPLKSRLLRTVKTCPVLICTRQAAAEAHPKHAERIAKRGVEILNVAQASQSSNLHSLLDELSGRGIQQVLVEGGPKDELSGRGIQQVLVEGGPKVLTSFLKEGLADEVVVYIAPKILAADGTAYIAEPMTAQLAGIDLEHVEIKAFADDVRVSGRVKRA